ncbi:hypothetical protein MMC19_005888 [Ptychographa xylographoides]|nr:hypothetical protein [Ptychographa xylographoides]
MKFTNHSDHHHIGENVERCAQPTSKKKNTSSGTTVSTSAWTGETFEKRIMRNFLIVNAEDSKAFNASTTGAVRHMAFHVSASGTVQPRLTSRTVSVTDCPDFGILGCDRNIEMGL